LVDYRTNASLAYHSQSFLRHICAADNVNNKTVTKQDQSLFTAFVTTSRLLSEACWCFVFICFPYFLSFV